MLADCVPTVLPPADAPRPLMAPKPTRPPTTHLQTVMAWDEEGALLATASKKGTVVRVHAVRGR